MKSLLVVVAAVLLFTGCTIPETKIYNLSLPAEKEHAPAGEGETVYLLVHSPRYLDQPYIVYRTSPYELRIASYSKWDEPPAEIVRQAIRDSLSSVCCFRTVRSARFIPAGSYGLEIDLRKFERSDDGKESFADVAFDAVLFSPDGGELYHASISKYRKLEDRSFLNVAKALSAALADGMEELKTGIAKAVPQAARP